MLCKYLLVVTAVCSVCICMEVEIGDCEVSSSLPTFAWVLGFELRSSDSYSKSFAPSVSVDGDWGSERPKCTFLPSPFALLDPFHIY